MAKAVLMDGTILYGKHELGANVSSFSFETAQDLVDCTNFASAGWREHEAGLNSTAVNIQAYGEADATLSQPDLDYSTDNGSFPIAGSITRTAAEGDVFYASQVKRAQYQSVANVGELWGVQIAASGDEVGVRGNLLAAVAASASSGTTTSQQLGALTATQTAYAYLFCTQMDAGSLDVVVRSDDNAGATSAVARMTFTQLTAPGYQRMSLAGALAGEDYWDVDYTIVTGPVTFWVVFGIATS